MDKIGAAHLLSMQAPGLLSAGHGGQQREPVIQKNCRAQCSHLTCFCFLFCDVRMYMVGGMWGKPMDRRRVYTTTTQDKSKRALTLLGSFHWERYTHMSLNWSQALL